MTQTAHAKPPAPLLTRAMQLVGLAGVVAGAWIMVDASDCTELDCLALPIGILVAGYGVIALLSGLRGKAGLLFLVAAIVLPLLVLWMNFLIAILFFGAVMLLTRVSKDRLAPYYRSGGERE